MDSEIIGLLGFVALFILMGLLLARANLGHDLYDLFNKALWCVRRPSSAGSSPGS